MNKYLPGDPFAYRGTHRKPRTRRFVKVAALAAPMTLAGLMIVGATPMAAQASTHKPVNWTVRTCSALTAYEGHPSRANLDRLVTDSFHVPAKYLGQDVASLDSAVLNHGDRDLAIQYAGGDCGWGGM